MEKSKEKKIYILKEIQRKMEETRNLDSVQMVTRAGNSLAIIVPNKIVKIMGLKYKDYVKVTFIERIKSNEKEGEKELPEF